MAAFESSEMIATANDDEGRDASNKECSEEESEYLRPVMMN